LNYINHIPLSITSSLYSQSNFTSSIIYNSLIKTTWKQTFKTTTAALLTATATFALVGTTAPVLTAPVDAPAVLKKAGEARCFSCYLSSYDG
jgi:hypothetical protein